MPPVSQLSTLKEGEVTYDLVLLHSSGILLVRFQAVYEVDSILVRRIHAETFDDCCGSVST